MLGRATHVLLRLYYHTPLVLSLPARVGMSKDRPPALRSGESEHCPGSFDMAALRPSSGWGELVAALRERFGSLPWPPFTPPSAFGARSGCRCHADRTVSPSRVFDLVSDVFNGGDTAF